MHRFFGISLVCVSQGKAALSWDTPHYLSLLRTHTHTFFFHFPVPFRTSCRLQDTFLHSVGGMGPTLFALDNELKLC